MTFRFVCSCGCCGAIADNTLLTFLRLSLLSGVQSVREACNPGLLSTTAHPLGFDKRSEGTPREAQAAHAGGCAGQVERQMLASRLAPTVFLCVCTWQFIPNVAQAVFTVATSIATAYGAETAASSSSTGGRKKRTSAASAATSSRVDDSTLSNEQRAKRFKIAELLSKEAVTQQHIRHELEQVMQ